MSAKRRQETIAQFSVPLREEAAEAAPAGNSTTGKRKRTSSSRPIAVDDDFPFPEILRTDRDDDSDFIVDDDDLSDAYDDTSSPVKPKKGKGKAKGKGKGKARSDSPDTFDRSYSGENPKVMLISLKAVGFYLYIFSVSRSYTLLSGRSWAEFDWWVHILMASEYEWAHFVPQVANNVYL